MTQMMELEDKVIKTLVVTVVMQEIKNSLDQINSKLGIAEKKISKLLDVAKETIQSETF